MHDEKTLKKLLCKREITPNILMPDIRAYDDGKQQLFIAGPDLCSLAQNIIDETAEHKHLKLAKILLLVRTTEKKKHGRRIGYAAKAKLREKFLSRYGNSIIDTIDFVIWLDGDWLAETGGAVNRGHDIKADNPEGIRKVIGLLDHELLHCGAKIAGEFVTKQELYQYVSDLGMRHIETVEDESRDDPEEVFVRYYYVNKAGKLIWKLRKHDIEEFEGAIKRNGKWNDSIGPVVDVIIELDKNLFSKAGK